MIGLFYDTETTGLPLFHEPSEDPRQPHLVQIAASLVDLETQELQASLDLVVRPEGWEIPDDMANIHGISTDYARMVGIPEQLALQVFLELTGFRLRIGFNEAFDARIIRIAMKRFGITKPDPEAWKNAPAKCVKQMAEPIMRLPPTEKMRAAGRNHYKSPNLSEAYRFFCGDSLAGAHAAGVDMRACRDVYFAIEAHHHEGARA